MIRLDTDNLVPFLSEEALAARRKDVAAAHRTVLDGSGVGNAYLGWRDLLLDPNDALIEDIQTVADEIRDNADVFVSIGIGGSYLGARAVITALQPYFADRNRAEGEVTGPELLFAGHHMSGAYLAELLAYLEGKSVYVNVISKSGTTLEPALSFRFLREWLEARFSDADRRIIVTTDPKEGALNALRAEKGYRKYAIPPSVGGRFSVLTPVGLLPIAVGGIDIQSLFYGAKALCEEIASAAEHDVLTYAGARDALYREGYKIETLAVFEPRLSGIGGWWQQLFGESEGKQNRGLFPATMQFSTDLHSLGQYMQEGERILIETFIMVENDGGGLMAKPDPANLDGLNYLAGKTLTEINLKAYEGTARAHHAGGVPNQTLWLPSVSPENIGACLYFFEHAVAVSGYLLGVNPFDQPGVEAYKKEMFRRLGKP